MSSRRITILGGDQRNRVLANLLADDGHQVMVYGFEKVEENKRLIRENSFRKAIEFSDIIIGPVPFAEKDGGLNVENHKYSLSIKKIFESIREDQVFIGGYIRDEDKSLAKKYPFKLIDMYEREEMRILNAIPTAEGAIQMAMEGMDITIHASKALVLGFGRVGEILSKMLKGIGADVYPVARSHKDLSRIKSYGYKAVKLTEIDKYLGQVDVIFNTIPKTILDETMLKLLKKDILIVDNASNPGGVDHQAAKKLGIKVDRFLGLPGKAAPITAALCMKDTIFNIIEELGI